MPLAADADEHLIHVPLIARSWSAPLQRIGEDPAKAQAPLADALLADHDPTRRQDQLDITEAQAEAVIEPHGMLDDPENGNRDTGSAISACRAGCTVRQALPT